MNGYGTHVDDGGLARNTVVNQSPREVDVVAHYVVGRVPRASRSGTMDYKVVTVAERKASGMAVDGVTVGFQFIANVGADETF